VREKLAYDWAKIRYKILTEAIINKKNEYQVFVDSIAMHISRFDTVKGRYLRHGCHLAHDCPRKEGCL
jgi:hypothetical protein